MQISRIGIHESVEAVFPPENLRNKLSDFGPDVAVVSDADVNACDALVTLQYSEAFLETTLQWIQSIQAGVDRFPFDELRERGIVLTNSTGIHGEAVGETVVCYMLMLTRLQHRYRWTQREHRWDRPDWHEPSTLNKKSLCVVGLGTLGRGIATRASALGMKVIGVRRTVGPIEGVSEIYPESALHKAITDRDFVALAVPLTDDTHHLFSTAEFETIGKDAYLMNVARGSVVDELALIEALENGDIAGAALDVFEEEPLPKDSPLWDMENVIVTPHTSAHTRDYYRNVANIVRENIERIDTGEELMNRIL
jgi:D-2-hydroxyacid dehydrogenase (NADP+)